MNNLFSDHDIQAPCINTNTLVVNLFAGPGAGKSTIRADIFADLKWLNISCEEAYEVAKDYVWDKHFEIFKDQTFLLGMQWHRVFRLLGQVDVIITDCPVLLSAIYDSEKCPIFEALVVKRHYQLWTYNVFLQRTKSYHKNGRMHDELQAKDIDKNVLDLLNKWKIPYETVEGNREGKDAIVQRIIEIHKRNKS